MRQGRCRKFITCLPVEVRGQPEEMRRAFGWHDAEGTDHAEFPLAWHIDPARSRIEFAVRHMVITTARGCFTEFAGDVVFDEQEPVLSSAVARIRVASLSTGERERDAALLAPDFLDAATYPEITFRSRRVQPLGPGRGRIIGDLTIRDRIQRVTLETRLVARSEGRARFAATTALSRKAWGLTWSLAVEAGGLAVGDEIKVSLVVEIVEELLTHYEWGITN